MLEKEYIATTINLPFLQEGYHLDWCTFFQAIVPLGNTKQSSQVVGVIPSWVDFTFLPSSPIPYHSVSLPFL
ncbi:hypothetical protein CAP36_08435 [Chitinophagaceae bacterium IBVUCB2]|nr:hypothetical protein CAP36_08435 [Chitinophagaceae bacterium IBVUCB2]